MSPDFWSNHVSSLIDHTALSLSVATPLGPGIGTGRAIDTPVGHSETTIFGGGNDTMPFLDQVGPACGTTSLAMITSYLTGQSLDQNQVDSEIRRLNVFTSPGEMIEFARDRGLQAEMYNDGTWGELKGFIDRGIPCQALISNDNTGDFSTLHYVAVVGYGVDKDGKEYVILHDPNQGDDPNTTAQEGGLVRMPLEEFQQKWKNPPAGFDNFFIAYAPGGTDLPPGRDDGIEGTLTTSEGIANITNGLDRIANSFDSPLTFYRGAFEVQAGVVQTLGGGITGGLQLGGDWINEQVEDIPVVENIVGPVADVISGVGAVGADLVNGVGEAIEDLGEGLEKLGKGDVLGFGGEVIEAGGEIIEGVGEALEDAGNTVVNVVKSIFSGW